eukprot:1341791-Amorphochlora_amoeboformis.AAC.1
MAVDGWVAWDKIEHFGGCLCIVITGVEIVVSFSSFLSSTSETSGGFGGSGSRGPGARGHVIGIPGDSGGSFSLSCNSIR